MQSMSITINVVSSNPVQGEVYSIQYYVIMYVSDLWISLGTPVALFTKNRKYGPNVFT
jgi:hypothetical protein